MRYIEHTIDKMEGVQKELALQMLDDPDLFSAKKDFAKWYRVQSSDADGFVKEIHDNLAIFRPNLNQIQTEKYIVDIIASNALYGTSPAEFLKYHFEEKTDAARNTYITDAEKFIIFRPFYDFSQYEYVRDKWKQYSRLKEFFARDCMLLCEHSETEYEAFVRFVKAHPVFIFKPTRMSCGEGVQLIDTRNADIAELYCSLTKSGGIADEKIEQNAIMSQFHSESANTIRIICLRDSIQHKSYFTQALLRIGQGDDVIDNNEKAVRARIDVDSGIVYTVGLDGMGNTYIVHPDSNVKIVGFQVPQWETMLNMADKAMSVMESYAGFIGFDFALSVTGWKIVEVNPFPQIYIQQMIGQTGSRPELLRLVKLCHKEIS